MTSPHDEELVLLSAESVARLAGISSRDLRRYETEGLIIAEEVTSSGRTERLYAVSTVRLVRRIHSYERIGVNLAGIEIILRLLEQLQQQRER